MTPYQIHRVRTFITYSIISAVVFLAVFFVGLLYYLANYEPEPETRCFETAVMEYGYCRAQRRWEI